MLRKSQSSVESVDQFVSRARQKLSEKRIEAALAEFEAALSLRPGDASILKLVEDTRAKIAELRERIVQARRLMSDRAYDQAATTLKAVLADLPTKTLCLDLSILGKVSVPVGLLVFALRYTGLQKWVTGRTLVFACVFPRRQSSCTGPTRGTTSTGAAGRSPGSVAMRGISGPAGPGSG